MVRGESESTRVESQRESHNPAAQDREATTLGSPPESVDQLIHIEPKRMLSHRGCSIFVSVALLLLVGVSVGLHQRFEHKPLPGDVTFELEFDGRTFIPNDRVELLSAFDPTLPAIEQFAPNGKLSAYLSVPGKYSLYARPKLDLSSALPEVDTSSSGEILVFGRRDIIDVKYAETYTAQLKLAPSRIVPPNK